MVLKSEADYSYATDSDSRSTQADDTDVINEYQIAYHLSADNWSGFFGENNSNGWNAGSNNTTYYLLDNWIKATYTQSYTNALDPWKKLKIASEKNGTPEVFALAQILKISAWHKTLEVSVRCLILMRRTLQ